MASNELDPRSGTPPTIRIEPERNPIMYLNHIHLDRLHRALSEAIDLVEDIRRIDAAKQHQLDGGGGTIINRGELSSRAKSVIATYDVKTMEDLAALTRSDLILARNAGEKTYRELLQLLRNHGLAFSEKRQRKAS